MSALKGKKKSHKAAEDNVEVRVRARSVSRGVAIGNVVSLHGEQKQFYKVALDDSAAAVEKEIRRFRAAIRLAARQLKRIGEKKTGVSQQSHIFDVHLLILKDKTYLSQIESEIADQKVNAEWAVKTVTDGYKARYKNISDEYLRERYVDLLDVSGQILTALDGGRGKTPMHLEKDSIVVAQEVKPSTLIELFESKPKAIVAERGGWTSHTFILAREMNLPAVTGSAGILKRVKNGDELIVDGNSGQIIIHPSAETVRNYANAIEFEQFDGNHLDDAGQTVKTLDGREIIVRANLDLPDGYEQAKRFGARGIGLYRSEYLFNQSRGFPTESEQTEVYRQIAETVGKNGVRIRTFDLSAEQFAGDSSKKETNPALGLRAIRFSLRYKKQFRAQLRAILQAAYRNKIDIIVPMICDVAEIIAIKKIIKSEKTSLIKKNIKIGDPLIGAMIEVPAAVFTIEEIASEVDFLCLGTNDLVQYLLAVDRDNESVAEWFQTLHPAVLRAIKKVLTAAEEARIPAVICGEMAGSPFYAPILIGLGATELSMNVNSLPRVRKVLSGIAFEEARALVGNIKKCRTAAEIESVVRQNIRDKWAHLFPAEI